MWIALCAAAAHSQYTISAMAGYIHHTEGEVWLGDRAIQPKPEDFEHVIEGRRLRTGKGRAEILLVPGSFVRVGEQSEIEMVSSGLTSAEVRLHAGSVIVDLQTIFEDDSVAFLIDDREVRFRKPGVYRLERGDTASLRVFEGRARVESQNASFNVKSGQQCDVLAGAPEKAGDVEADALDHWHVERHEQLTVLAEEARKERWQGMSEAERDLLRMILNRPRTSTGGRQPSSTSSTGNSNSSRR